MSREIDLTWDRRPLASASRHAINVFASAAPPPTVPISNPTPTNSTAPRICGTDPRASSTVASTSGVSIFDASRSTVAASTPVPGAGTSTPDASGSRGEEHMIEFYVI